MYTWLACMECEFRPEPAVAIVPRSLWSGRCFKRKLATTPPVPYRGKYDAAKTLSLALPVERKT